MLSKENVQDIYSLSPMQQGMLLQFAVDPASAAYFEQFDFHLTGEINLPALQKSLYSLIAKYDVLRTIFSFRKTDLPRQIVLKQRAIEKMQIVHHDLREHDMAAAEYALEAFKVLDRSKVFDLSQDVLLRLSLVSLPEQRQHLIFSFHHIILDGWCMGTLLGDLFGYYDRYCENLQQDIREREAFAYRNYIGWIEQQDGQAAQAYWQQALQGYQTEVGIPYSDMKRQAALNAGVASEQENSAVDYEFSLGIELTARLQALAQDARITLNSLFQSVWGILLQKYNNTDDVAFGCVISGRPPALPGVEKMIGLFLNSQPIRVTCNATDNFLDVAKKVHQNLLAALAYDYYPLSSVQSASQLKNHLINHTIAFENFPLGEQLRQLQGSSLQVGECKVFQAAKFDFDVIVYPGEQLRINFVHNPRRYATSLMASMARSLVSLFTNIAAQPDQQIQHLHLCAAQDAQAMLRDWSSCPRPYPAHESVTSLFLQMVAQHPHNLALVYCEERYTYQQLHQVVQRHAQQLRKAGVHEGDNVAILTQRSAAMVIGVLASYYCGASYMPLEAGSSTERMRFILQDGGAKLVCSVTDMQAMIPSEFTSYLLDAAAVEPVDAEVAEQASQFVPTPATPESVAYVMYTSGSTGQPKGCCITHRNIVRLVTNTNYVDFSLPQRMLQTCSNAFDGSTIEFWGPLLNGGQLYVVDRERLLDPKLFRATIEEYGITTIGMTSALFNQHCDTDPTIFASLQNLLVGGDILSPTHAEKVRLANPQLKLFNGYGPTENTCFSTTFPIVCAHPDGIPIGKPIANSTCHILDPLGQMLPPGAFGELCLGGDGVALGYLNRPELNAEKFIAAPFNEGGRIYRTGDIARWLPDGNISILGRNDFQVKVRGFRVELGEIERALCQIPGIKDAVVIAHESQSGQAGKHLHAFYVASQSFEARQLRAALSATLASYMVPTFYMPIERMPLTLNGKLDRRQLPIEASFALSANAEVVPARNQTEHKIAQVCQQVLRLENIGMFDNFFEVGANSLNLIAIHNRLKEIFARDFPLTSLFEHTSVAQLAGFLDQDQAVLREKAAREEEDLAVAKSALLKTRNLMRAMDDE